MQPGTVLITGGGSGIGLAAALEFARHGWKLGLIGRGRPALADAARQVTAAYRGAGGAAAAVHIAPADVTDAGALAAAAREIEAALGPITVWVNNAGIGFYGAFTDVPDEAFRRVIEVNLFGTINGTRIALSLMRPRDRGVIVQVLSAISYRAVPLMSSYSTSKYALRGFTEALRAELLHDRSGVRVTMVHPPAVNTPFYSHAGSVMEKPPRPPPPIYQPEILGDAVYRAAVTPRREWQVTGSSLAFAIGNKLAPDLMDKVSAVVGPPLQQTDDAAAMAARDVNVFAPSSRAAGSHGPFDAESRSGSVQWTLNRNAGTVRFGLGLLAMGAVALFGRKRR